MYALALATPRDAVPVDNWRKAVIARGVNLLLSLGNPGTAASVFEAEVVAAPDASGTDALLLGVVNARLQQGNRKEAEAAVRTLEKKYPKSPYAERARQNLDATGK
jgi:TolA-binding protein